MLEMRSNRRKRASIVPRYLHEHIGYALYRAFAIHLLRDYRGSSEWKCRVGLVKGRMARTILFGQLSWNAIENAPDLLCHRWRSGQRNRALSAMQLDPFDLVALENRRAIHSRLTIQSRR